MLDAWLAYCIALRETMRWLRDPVVFAPWPPAVPAVLPCSGIRMLRLREVERRVGLRKSQIYRDIAAGMFPPPAPLGARVRRWPAHEVDEWLSGRVALVAALRREAWPWGLPRPRSGVQPR